MAIVLLSSPLSGLTLPPLACEVRRFYDQDRSGWFVLINFIPCVGALIVFAMMLIGGTKATTSLAQIPKNNLGSLTVEQT
jgi:uncharacterized membrane protein YhaH (DUF805 family)